MSDSLTSKVNEWLDKSGYPLEMRVTQRLHSAPLSQQWERDPNLLYTDADTGTSRETDYYLDLWEDNKWFNIVFRLVIECKSTTTPWVVFQRPNGIAQVSPVKPSSLWDVNRNLTYYFAQRSGQMTRVVAALELFLRGRVSTWPAPGYAIAEAFKGPNDRDVAYNAARQALSAAVGTMGTNIWGGMDSPQPGCSSITPIVITTSPLFEARLVDDGSRVVTTQVPCTALWVTAKGITETRVVIANESCIDTILADCLALEQHLPEFLEISSVDLIEIGDGEFSMTQHG